MAKIFVLVILVFINLAFATNNTGTNGRHTCKYRSGGTEVVCDDIFEPSFAQEIKETTKLM